MGGEEPFLSNQDSARWGGVKEELSYLGGTMSLVVSMVGTGVVAFPYAFALCGYFVGPSLLILVGMLSYFSYVSLTQCTVKVYATSYEGLLQTVPKIWGHYSTISLWLLLAMATSAYVLISADIIRSVSLNDAGESPAVFQSESLFAIILLSVSPLCLVRSFYGLSVISTYCTCAILAVALLIVWQTYCIYSSESSLERPLPTASTEPRSAILAVPIFAGAMFGHMNMSQIYAELQPNVKPRAHQVALAACVGTGTLYMVIGGFGYAAFGTLTQPDIVAQIAGHEGGHGTVDLIQGLLASIIFFKMPLMFIPLRSVTLGILGSTTSPSELSKPSHAVLTYSLLVCVYLAAVALPYLDTLLELLGAICAVPLCFLVPARISWAAEFPRPLVRCLIMALFGIVASVVSLASIVAS